MAAARGLGDFKKNADGTFCVGQDPPPGTWAAQFGGSWTCSNAPAPSSPASPGNIWVVYPKQPPVQVPQSFLATFGFQPGQGTYDPTTNTYNLPLFAYQQAAGLPTPSGIQPINPKQTLLQAEGAAPSSPVPPTSAPPTTPTSQAPANPSTSAAPPPAGSQTVTTSSGVPSFLSSLQTDLSSVIPAGSPFGAIPWWGWLIGAGVGVYALSKAK